MLCIKFYIGTQYDYSQKLISERAAEAIEQSCIARVLESCDGVTVYHVHGAWKNSYGQVMHERTIVIETIASLTPAKIRGIQHDLELIAEQDTVLVTVQSIINVEGI